MKFLKIFLFQFLPMVPNFLDPIWAILGMVQFLWEKYTSDQWIFTQVCVQGGTVRYSPLTRPGLPWLASAVNNFTILFIFNSSHNLKENKEPWEVHITHCVSKLLNENFIKLLHWQTSFWLNESMKAPSHNMSWSHQWENADN